ncbi:DUF1203 domain-containing protein [Sphingomonas sp. BN140010]|uniref:DUF1203 domain-containing protein n=1 Tax=Sphingomonas arvum TaxID=2992113 RepID=A0ABT3JEE1_9SPHN|nr:DUF1203 domain-containing protein [Sphingomonas sp. BN140010]MCW3797424.1 DUF1203 domain-containing protein [Sphingomonas sp. BN140010]
MTYRITGLDPAAFRPLFHLRPAALAERGVRRMPVTSFPGFPCRLTLDDAELGETVLLVNYQSVPAGPYRARHAIFITEGLTEAASFMDAVPPALERRTLSLRAFDRDWDMVAAELAQPGEADGAIRRMLADPAVTIIHAHNATRGCFAAAVERA